MTLTHEISDGIKDNDLIRVASLKLAELTIALLFVIEASLSCDVL